MNRIPRTTAHPGAVGPGAPAPLNPAHPATPSLLRTRSGALTAGMLTGWLLLQAFLATTEPLQ